MHERLIQQMEGMITERRQQIEMYPVKQSGPDEELNLLIVELVGMIRMCELVRSWLDTLCPHCRKEMEQVSSTGLDHKWACYDCFYYHPQGDKT